MGDGEGTLSIALLSGTDDKLNAAALLTAGAAALGRKVDILLQYWALEAFRAGNPTKDHGLAPRPDPTAPPRSSGSRPRAAPSTGARYSPRPRNSARSGSMPARCRWTCSA
jgi:peroxiredoxin family protein